MKSLQSKKTSLQNVISSEEIVYERELKFDSGITRAMLSGIIRHTIRKGKRHFARSITIHGYPAVVSEVSYTTLLHADIKMLHQEFGFKSIFAALLALQRYYPGLTLNDQISIVAFRLTGV